MEYLNIIINFKYVEQITYAIKIFFISMCTYYFFFRITNRKNNIKNNVFIICIITIAISIISAVIKYKSNSIISVMCLVLSLSVLYAKKTNDNIGYSMLVTIISLSINYILLFNSLIICYSLNSIINIQNDYFILFIIIFFHILLTYIFFKIRKFKYGFKFLNKNLRNEYLNILVLNVSIIVLFSAIIFTSTDKALTINIFFGFIIFSIIMFITIQKSLQLYYKQKLLIQDLNETKEELKKKNEEIKELEKENLNFSKTSHSIAHKQKSLEYKLNQLMLKNEIASEIDIKDRINDISKQIYNKTTQVELEKTSIIEIDEMLKYMQSECIKNKIDFQIQISGNIYQMINNHISKENLEILIADHIKNAIIAINHSNSTNKSILVRLGMINGFYSLYVYDSGIEFEIDTLLNLGKRPSTTHADSGGTGMGFMNTFDTLNKYKASMIITEYNKPCKDKYTKVIKIKFDKKNEFKISTYRDEQIKNKDTKNNLIVEKIS